MLRSETQMPTPGGDRAWRVSMETTLNAFHDTTDGPLLPDPSWPTVMPASAAPSTRIAMPPGPGLHRSPSSDSAC